MHAPCLLARCSTALLLYMKNSYGSTAVSLRSAARLLMMHDRLLGRLTCNLLLY
jgi:hypothetical protein